MSEQLSKNKAVTSLICDSCGGKGVVKLIIKRLRNGEISIKVTQCSVCKRQYGINGVSSLKLVETA